MIIQKVTKINVNKGDALSLFDDLTSREGESGDLVRSPYDDAFEEEFRSFDDLTERYEDEEEGDDFDDLTSREGDSGDLVRINYD